MLYGPLTKVTSHKLGRVYSNIICFHYYISFVLNMHLITHRLVKSELTTQKLVDSQLTTRILFVIQLTDTQLAD